MIPPKKKCHLRPWSEMLKMAFMTVPSNNAKAYPPIIKLQAIVAEGGSHSATNHPTAVRRRAIDHVPRRRAEFEKYPPTICSVKASRYRHTINRIRYLCSRQIAMKARTKRLNISAGRNQR
jgi:hypothetical protein